MKNFNGNAVPENGQWTATGEVDKLASMKRFGLFVFLLWGAAARADDSGIYGEGGRVHRLGKEHASVRMVSETVDITVRDLHSYTTDATFVFHNDGPATTVKMGFPEWARGVDETLDKKRSSFQEFATWADGRRLPTHRVWNSKEEAFWVKEVPFHANQTRRVRVRFRAVYGDSSRGLGMHWIKYDFTGGNWKGKLDQAVLTLHLDRPGTYLLGEETEKSHPSFARREGEFKWIWTNWKAEDNFYVSLDTTLRNWLAIGGGDKDLRSYLPVKIGTAKDEKGVDFVPDAVVRNGQTFLHLGAWTNVPATKASAQWDEASGVAIVRRGAKESRFRAGREGAFIVRGNFGNQDTLFVPAAQWERDLGGRFVVNLPQHAIRFVSEKAGTN